MEIGENVSEPRIDGPDSSTRDENGVQSVKEEASSTTNLDGQSEMEIEEDNVVKYTFDESYMPLKALKLTTEQDDYRYYVHPLTQRVFSLDTAGYWYIQLEDQSYVPVEQTSLEPEKKAEAASATIIIGADGYPDFPKNEKGQPILPKSLDGKPVFPVDGSGNPMFPFDHQKKQWCFPLDEKERPIFPFNADGKPVVPVDDKGKPIFPQDTSGNFLFPVDKSNIPIPAMTVDGRSVVPYDEYGKPVIPTDKEGNPLIFMSADGVTYISKDDYIKWQAYWEEQTKLYNQQQVQSYQAPTSVFHPLNIEQATAIDWTNVEMLQRSKRIRPEDVDLPSMDMGYSYDSPEGQMLSYHGQHQLAQQPQEDEKTLKRKKMLAAQLKFTKQLGEKKDKPAEKPIKMELSTPPKPPKIESKEVKKSSKVDTLRKREEKSTPRKRSRSPARRDRRDEPRNGRKVERSPPPPPTTKKPNWMEQARAKRVENVKNKPFKRNYSISPVRKQGQKRSRSSSSSRSRSRPRKRGRSRSNSSSSSSASRSPSPKRYNSRKQQPISRKDDKLDKHSKKPDKNQKRQRSPSSSSSESRSRSGSQSDSSSSSRSSSRSRSRGKTGKQSRGSSEEKRLREKLLKAYSGKTTKNDKRSSKSRESSRTRSKTPEKEKTRPIKLLLPKENGVQKEEKIVPNEPPKEEKSQEVQQAQLQIEPPCYEPQEFRIMSPRQNSTPQESVERIGNNVQSNSDTYGPIPPPPGGDLPNSNDKAAYRLIYEKLKMEVATQKQECERLKKRIEQLKTEKKERKGLIKEMEKQQEKFEETGTCAFPEKTEIDGKIKSADDKS